MDINPIDADQSSFQIQEMTANQITIFRDRQEKNKKQKPKSKKKISSSEESSSSEPPRPIQKKTNRFNYNKNRNSRDKKRGKGQCRSKPKTKNKRTSKAKEVSRQVISKNKRQKEQSSESSSSDEKQSRVVKTKQKASVYVPLTPQARYMQQVKEDQLLRYGNAKFVKHGKKSPLIGYTPKSKQIIRTGVTWWVCNGQYLQHDWSNIFSDMYQAQIRDLRLLNNKHFNIIKDINHVHFPNLTILNLNENNIKSIELLSRMRFPLLSDLALRQNRITNINCLFRMSLDHLELFSITDNPILQMDKLYYINSNCLKEMYFEWKSSAVICEDLSWMAKLKKDQNKISAMDKIVIQSKNRISQKMVDLMIAQKYRKVVNVIIKRRMT